MPKANSFPIGGTKMGPFPHNVPKLQISNDPLAGTYGFEFVEVAHPDPQDLRDLVSRMSHALVARHISNDVELWQQGDITYILNADRPGGFFMRDQPLGIFRVRLRPPF